LVRRAKVSMLVVSRPALGSVTPKQAFCSPLISGVSQRAFCSAVPCTTMACGPNRLMWMVEAAEKPPPPRVTACIMMAASVTPSPAPPSSSGMVMPSQPAFGHRLVEFVRESGALVAFGPVIVAETGADLGSRCRRWRAGRRKARCPRRLRTRIAGSLSLPRASQPAIRADNFVQEIASRPWPPNFDFCAKSANRLRPTCEEDLISAPGADVWGAWV
jgi:hypothetical protein